MATVRQNALWDFIPVRDIQVKVLPKPKRSQPAQARTTVARFLHLGAGLQSSTLAEMIIEGKVERVDAVFFADTGNEPSWVYRQVEYLKKRMELVDIPLIVVKKPNSEGIVKDLKAPSLRIATMPLYSLNPITGKRAILKRQCTNEYKIVPCDDAILAWLLENGHAKVNSRGARRVNQSVQVENLYGISADESWRQESNKKRKQAWKVRIDPLIQMNYGRADCVSWLHAHSLPIPKKSSCIVCPYHDDAYWYDLQVNSPEEFEEACVFDEWLRTPEAKLYGNFRGIRDELYLHSSCQPLRSIDFKARLDAKKTGQMDMFKAELVTGRTCATDGGFTCMS